MGRPWAVPTTSSEEVVTRTSSEEMLSLPSPSSSTADAAAVATRATPAKACASNAIRSNSAKVLACKPGPSYGSEPLNISTCATSNAQAGGSSLSKESSTSKMRPAFGRRSLNTNAFMAITEPVLCRDCETSQTIGDGKKERNSGAAARPRSTAPEVPAVTMANSTGVAAATFRSHTANLCIRSSPPRKTSRNNCRNAASPAVLQKPSKAAPIGLPAHMPGGVEPNFVGTPLALHHWANSLQCTWAAMSPFK
mmetsp:Transcript_87400/g.280322  ORF Transcript_87400/g.280322 Transcript_87400/m.280322 type:complete len:252 (-) Transcript_87400:225-980(-)